MKVLFTASTYSHIVNFHLPYLRQFQKAGWVVHVACGGKRMEIPCADQIIRLPLQKSLKSLNNFRAAAILRKWIRQENYTLICTHTSLAAFFTRLALQGLKKPPEVVNMVHGYLFDDATSPLKRMVLLASERWTAPATDLVLTMNQFDYETAVRYQLGRKIVYIPGVGVDFSRLRCRADGSCSCMRERLGIPKDAFVLIYAAEFSARKSQSVLIRAMGRLPECVALVLAGDGALRQNCVALAERLGLSERIRFPGQVSQMGEWYAMADLAVSASRSEGLPFNILEAMYMGLPVVASSVKGHKDLIVHGETGLLYPYGDHQACTDQIICLLDSEELRRRLADRARQAVMQYDIRQVLPKVWAEYCSVVSDGRS